MEMAESRKGEILKRSETGPELWDAYLADETVTGETLVRGEPIPEGLHHAVAEVFVMHTDGFVLLMQRDKRKPNFPGCWESGASGSVVKGESFLQGAIRELREETGICAEVLEPIYTAMNKNTIYKGYLCRTDAPRDSVTLQPGETIAYQWVDRQKFLEIYRSEDFVGSLRERLRDFVQGL